MNKQINITYKDIDYVLEYTRKSVQQLEQMGFRIDLLYKEPLTYVPMLFTGAFFKNHPDMDIDTASEIYEQIPNKDNFIEKLAEMYVEPVAALMNEPEKGNVKWEVNW